MLSETMGCSAHHSLQQVHLSYSRIKVLPVHPDLGQGHLLLLQVVVVVLAGSDCSGARLQQRRTLRVATPPSPQPLHLQQVNIGMAVDTSPVLFAACT
jgi:hypothetical protein